MDYLDDLASLIASIQFFGSGDKSIAAPHKFRHRKCREWESSGLPKTKRVDFDRMEKMYNGYDRGTNNQSYVRLPLDKLIKRRP